MPQIPPDTVPRNTTAEHPAGEPERMCFLTEKSPLWAGMLADVLRQHRVPFVQESSLGAGLAIQTGSLSERIRFFVPGSHLAAARDLAEELFSEDRL